MVILKLQNIRTRKSSVIKSEKGIESPAEYKEFADLLPQTVFEFDINGNIIFVNQRGFEIFGYVPDDFKKGLNAFHMVIPQDRSRIREDIIKLLQGEKLDALEYTALRKNSTTFPIAVYATVITRQDKTAVIRGFVIDISEQKETQEELKKSRDYLDKIINSIADPIFVKDRQHRWVLLNDACCEFIGHPRQELTGKSDYDYFPTKEADVFWDRDEAVFQGGKENINEEQITNAKGITHTIVTKKTLYVDSQGRRYIVGVIRDITERIQAEGERIRRERAEAELIERDKAAQTLKESEAKYRTLVENVNVGVYRNTGGPHGKFLHANVALAKIHGYDSVDEFMKVNVSDLYQNPQERQDFIEEIARKGFVKNKELYLRKKDGAPIIVSCTAKAQFDLKRNIKWIDGVIEDISSRKKVEQELQKYRERLEEEVEQRTKQLIEVNRKLQQEIVKHKETERELEGYKVHLEEQVEQRTREAKEVNRQLLAEISQHRGARKALQESEENFRAMVDNANDGILIASGEGTFVYANRRAGEITSYTVSELQGRTIRDLVHSQEFTRVIDKYKRRLKGELIPRQYETVMVQKEGKSIVVEVTGAKTIWQGKLADIFIIRDISRRKAMERQRAAMTSGLRTLAEIAEVLIACSDMEMLFRRAVELAKKELSLERCAIFVKKDGFIQGSYGINRCGKIINERDHKIVSSHMWEERLRMLRPQDPRWVTVEEPLIEWDGSREISFGQGWIAVTPIQSTHSPIGVFVNDSALTQSALDAVKQDVVAVFCSILGNIVERMQAEEVIRESEQKLKNALAELEKTYKQLQELDKMKSDFISIVSHELRTPLTSIKSSANILLKGGPQKHPIDERELELLNIIINNTDRQTRMINNLLDISKIEAGVLDMQMEPVDIVNVARDVVGTFQSQTQDKVITLHAFVSEKPLMVLADYEHIRRVFTNLIDNAIKFTPDKGKVSVKIEELGQEIRVIVSDTGIGISKNDALKIFNKFQRLNDSRVRKLGGTGLGLVIAKSIVEAHGGKIWPDSDPGQGASFYFTLPIHSDEAAEIIHRSVTISSMNQKRILIVDDEPDIVTTIKVVLEQEGYNTLCARDGKEALQKARQELPDLMILDLKLPLLSGEEVCRRIRKDEIIGKLPIIMLTAKDSDVDRVLGKVIGANHYIAKPFDVQRLLNVVSKIFKDYAGR